MAVNCQNLTFKVNTIFSKLFKLERRMLLLLWLNTSKQNFHFSGTKGPLKITFEMHCTIMNFIHCNFFAMAWLESSLLKRWCYGFTKTSMKCMLLRAAIIYIMEPQPVCTVGLFTNKCTNIQLHVSRLRNFHYTSDFLPLYLFSFTAVLMEKGRSIITFYYCSVNHQSGLYVDKHIFKTIIYFLIHYNVPQIRS